MTDLIRRHDCPRQQKGSLITESRLSGSEWIGTIDSQPFAQVPDTKIQSAHAQYIHLSGQTSGRFTGKYQSCAVPRGLLQPAYEVCLRNR